MCSNLNTNLAASRLIFTKFDCVTFAGRTCCRKMFLITRNVSVSSADIGPTILVASVLVQIFCEMRSPLWACYGILETSVILKPLKLCSPATFIVQLQLTSCSYCVCSVGWALQYSLTPQSRILENLIHSQSVSQSVN